MEVFEAIVKIISRESPLLADSSHLAEKAGIDKKCSLLSRKRTLTLKISL